jgi:SsrA-binding protein
MYRSEHTAMSRKKGKKARDAGGSEIAVNRRARHDYAIEETLVAGLVLRGWEVKSLRASRANLTEAYVILKDGEAWLVGAHFNPLPSASTHVETDPTRTRKLLLNRSEIARLIGAVERRGYTLVPLRLFWQKGLAKLAVGLAKGKKQHDKRASERERDWQREKQRLLKAH